MFQNLSDRIDGALHTLKGKGKLTEINVSQSVKEIRRALLDADVSYKIAKDFTARVKEKAMGENVITSINPGQLMTKIVHDELVTLMGSDQQGINLKENPTIILVVGLQGSGKTTFSGKLANYLKTKKQKNPMLAACDVYRPAAIDQLEVLGGQIDVPVYTNREEKNPVEIAKAAVAEAKKAGKNTIIIDTAGRLAVDEEMMTEVKNIHEAIKPTETLFVVDSMTGQDAVNTAKSFNDRLNFDGIVLTKLDGDTRGGAALTIRYVVNKPIKFIGTGEKLEALDLFYPSRMADRILGMGDVVSLVERAQEQFNEKEARRVQKKIAKNKFDFEDYLSQIQQIKRMGNMKDLVGMIPGAGKMLKGQEIDENMFKETEVIIQSMTKKERQNPKLINASRKKRIAKGSGTDVQKVNNLLKQFSQMSKMMKMMRGGAGAKMMQSMMNGGGMMK